MKEPLATISAANLSPHYPRGGGVKQVVQRKLVNRRLEEGKKRLKKLGRVEIPQEAFLSILNIDR